MFGEAEIKWVNKSALTKYISQRWEIIIFMRLSSLLHFKYKWPSWLYNYVTKKSLDKQQQMASNPRLWSKFYFPSVHYARISLCSLFNHEEAEVIHIIKILSYSVQKVFGHLGK